MHDLIKALKKENNELRKRIASLEQEEADFIAQEDAERAKAEEEHATQKKAMQDELLCTKLVTYFIEWYKQYCHRVKV